MDIEDINRKWADKPSLKLLWQKYVWGNRQKVFVWSIWNRKVTYKGDQYNVLSKPKDRKSG